MQLRAHPARACAGRPGFRATNPCRIARCWAPWPSARADHRNARGADVLATAAALGALGVELERHGDGVWRVHGVGIGGWPRPTRFSISATPAPALGCCSACSPAIRSRRSHRRRSLRARPMGRVITPLQAMGAASSRSGNRLPRAVVGTTELLPIRYACRSPRPRSSRRCSSRACTRPGGPRWSSRSRRATTPSGCSATSAPRSRSTDQEDGTHAVSVLGQPELAAAAIVVPEISRRRHFRWWPRARGRLVRAPGASASIRCAPDCSIAWRDGRASGSSRIRSRRRADRGSADRGRPLAAIEVPPARARMIDEYPILGRRGVRQGSTRMRGGRAQGQGKRSAARDRRWSVRLRRRGRGRGRGPGDSRLWRAAPGVRASSAP